LFSKNTGSWAAPAPEFLRSAQNYGVEKEGRYSAGTFSHPKAKRKTSRKQAPNVITQAPEDPEQ